MALKRNYIKSCESKIFIIINNLGVKMSIGTVKWFNTRKGYGFIQPSSGGKDVFVHVTKLEEKGIRRLYEGQKVGYELYDDRGRIAAGSIKILS